MKPRENMNQPRSESSRVLSPFQQGQIFRTATSDSCSQAATVTTTTTTTTRVDKSQVSSKQNSDHHKHWLNMAPSHSNHRRWTRTTTATHRTITSAGHLLSRFITTIVLVSFISLLMQSVRPKTKLLSLALLQPMNNNGEVQYQHNNLLHFEVSEGAPNNTWIGNIRSSDGQIPYLVVPSPKTPENELRAALSINLSTGDLITNSILDREHRSQYKFVAIVKEPFAEILCTVAVTDINDNAPMFLMSPPNETNFVIDIPEGQRGIRKTLPVAIDLDGHPYNIQEFKIISGNTPKGTFHLVEHGAPIGSTSRQQQSADDISISALLGADNPQIKQQLTQDETTLIPSQPFAASLASALGAGGGGGGVNSVGSQQSSSSTSSSSQATTSSAAGTSSTGTGTNINNPNSQQQVATAATSTTPTRHLIDLEVSRPLDRENQSSYQLIIDATDGGGLHGQVMVTVNVQDINDNEPVFLEKLYECRLQEDTPRGTLIVRVQAYDVDLDSNGQISYYIKHQSSSSQMATSLNQIGNSTAATAPNSDNSNSEVPSRYAQVNKQQQQQRVSSTSALNKQTNNAANTRQQQQQQQSTASYSTDTIYGGGGGEINSHSSVGDVPSGFKQRQTYPPDQLFDIDPNKGEIYLVNPLDYETDRVHEIIVEARDHGKPARSGTSKVIVHVIDVNDDYIPMAAAAASASSTSGLLGVGRDGRKLLGANSLDSSANAGPSTSARSSGAADYAFELGAQSSANGGFNQFGPFNQINLANLIGQLSSTVLFVIVLFALLAVGFSVFLVKIKSRQPESDYNDTAGLTGIAGNGSGGSNGLGQGGKPSPNHSSSNLEHPGTLDSTHYRHHGVGGGGDHHHHHHHQSRRSGLNGANIDGGSFVGLNSGSQLPFGAGVGGTPNGKLSRHGHLHHHNQYDNYYHNLHAEPRPRHHSSTSHHMVAGHDSLIDHQMAAGQASRSNTLTSHRHHHNHHTHGHHHLNHNHLQNQLRSSGAGGLDHSPLAGHHHHHHHLGQFANSPNHHNTTSSLTYAHHDSRAPLLHQSSHHLASIHQVGLNSGSNNNGGANNQNSLGGTGLSNNNKGGTMNSIGTHNSASQQHQQLHPLSNSPATPNTGSSQMPAISNQNNNHSHHHQSSSHHYQNYSSSHPHNQLLPSLPSGVGGSGGHHRGHPAHPHSNQFNHQLTNGANQNSSSISQAHHHHHHHHHGGLPTPPCHADLPDPIFQWPPAQDDCFTAGPDGGSQVILNTPGSTMNSRSTNGGVNVPNGANHASGELLHSPSLMSAASLDRWYDLGVPSQLIYSQDWCGSYNWDYLADWTPEYHTLLPYVLEKSREHR